MIVDIFIRTYAKDLDFLKYCLRSISKYVTGHRNIIICIPENEKHLLDSWNLTNEKVIGWIPTSKNGYIDQQINKLKAYTLTDADYILFVDSDVCFFKNIDVRKEYFVNEKPLLLKTRYELVGDAICWQGCTQDILNTKVDYEYMRRIPWLYGRKSFENLDKLININNLSCVERLSEFNLIGAYIDLYEPENYHIVDTDTGQFPEPCAKQGWSWGGLTKEVKEEFENYLK